MVCQYSQFDFNDSILRLAPYFSVHVLHYRNFSSDHLPGSCCEIRVTFSAFMGL